MIKIVEIFCSVRSFKVALGKQAWPVTEYRASIGGDNLIPSLLSFFPSLLDQQSEHNVFYKLMCWLGTNGVLEIHPVIYLLSVSSITID
jgi:hypothetical protein